MLYVDLVYVELVCVKNSLTGIRQTPQLIVVNAVWHCKHLALQAVFSAGGKTTLTGG